ncbi:MAG: hypothetical protein ACI8W8_001115 [Rhodothermales bacterium]|jgi:hypothetical protein
MTREGHGYAPTRTNPGRRRKARTRVCAFALELLLLSPMPAVTVAAEQPAAWPVDFYFADRDRLPQTQAPAESSNSCCSV